MRSIASFVLLLACVLTVGGTRSLAAQGGQPGSQPPVILSTPPANPADVGSIDAIVTALYDAISGGAGEARNWNRMRSLFIPGGRLMPLAPRPAGAVGIRVLELNDYIAVSGPMLERVGFREREVARRTEQFGHMAHVFSTYEGRLETEPTVIRGINSIQLINDGTRWWIINVYWEAESPTLSLPPHYLQSPATTN